MNKDVSHAKATYQRFAQEFPGIFDYAFYCDSTCFSPEFHSRNQDAAGDNGSCCGGHSIGEYSWTRIKLIYKRDKIDIHKDRKDHDKIFGLGLNEQISKYFRCRPNQRSITAYSRDFRVVFRPVGSKVLVVCIDDQNNVLFKSQSQERIRNFFLQLILNEIHSH